MEQTTHPCQRCGVMIPAARLEALAETRLCIQCSREIGGDFEVTISQENIGKAGSLKKNYGGIHVRRRRRKFIPKQLEDN